jgi:hypothetical protein
VFCERRKSVDKTAQRDPRGENTNADSMSRSKLSIFIARQVEVSSQSSLNRVANQQIIGVDRRRNGS